MPGLLPSTSALVAVYERHPIFKVVASSIALILILNVASSSLPPLASAQEVASPSQQSATTEMNELNESARESRLRSIEDELLKKLSLGGGSDAQEIPATAIPDIKHIESKRDTSKPPAAVVQQAAPTSAPLPPGVVEAHTDSPLRMPESSVVVPVVAKPATRRPTTIKRDTKSAKDSSASDLEHRLASAESQVTFLYKEVDSAKDALLKSELRVAELSTLLEEGRPQPGPHSYEIGEIEGNSSTSERIRETNHAETTSPTGRITKKSAALRVGPGGRESSILSLSRNSIVTIERRNGSWYRVITLAGTRGWVDGSSIVFSEGDISGSTVSIGAYRPEFEPTGIKY